jgi:pimeloyl-ACP methyl ester carboxylesterase
MGAIKSFIFGRKTVAPNELKAMYGSSPSQFIELSNGVNVHFRDEGNPKGLAVVFVHGHTEDLHTWSEMIRNMNGEFRLVRYDLRRHGLTGPAPDNDYKIDNYISDLSMFIENLGIERFVLVGHSMGGRISVKYAIENQKKVHALVLLSSSGAPLKEKGSSPMALRLMKNPLGRFLLKRLWSRKMAMKSLQGMVFDKSLISDIEIDRMWHFSKYPGNMDAMFKEFTTNWNDFNSNEINHIKTKTLLIWGQEDTICPEYMGDWYDTNLQNSRIVKLSEIGHNPQFESPKRCVEEISSFLEMIS